MTPSRSTNGLTWQQIALAITLIASALGQWVRMEVGMAEIRAALAAQPSPVALESRISKYEADNRQLQFEVASLRREISDLRGEVARRAR